MELKLSWGLTGGRSWMNVLHCRLTSATVNQALANQIMTGITGSAATTAFLAHVGNQVNFFSVRVKDLRQPNLAEFQSNAAGALGTGATAIVSLNDALVVTLRTAKSGQGFRGRVYLAGILQADQTSPTAFDTAVGGLAKNFIDGINSVTGGLSLPLVVAQRALNAGTHSDGSPWAARPADVNDVVSTEVTNARIDSQRRRLGR